MALVGENLVLLGQERAAGIDEIEARQAIVPRDVLGAKMLFHRHRIIGAALDGRIVGNDHAFAARHAPDPCDKARRMGIAAIESVRGKRADFQERRAGIEQQIDAVPRQKLAARYRGAAWPRALPPWQAAAIFSGQDWQAGRASPRHWRRIRGSGGRLRF